MTLHLTGTNAQFGLVCSTTMSVKTEGLFEILGVAAEERITCEASAVQI